jgi:hypothetical protein
MHKLLWLVALLVIVPIALRLRPRRSCPLPTAT